MTASIPLRMMNRRTLPLIPVVKDVLLEYKKKQAAYQSLFGKSYCRDYLDMVFVDQKGMLIKPARVTERFYSIIRKNNLKKVRFHDLRHSVASLLVAKGVDMKRIQHWLGHANYSTTADIYSHVSTGIHEETASVVVSALDGTVKKTMKGDDEI